MMTKHPKLLWIVVLLIGWAFDFLFWGKYLGINFAFFVGISVLGGLFLMWVNGLKPARKVFGCSYHSYSLPSSRLCARNH